MHKVIAIIQKVNNHCEIEKDVECEVTNGENPGHKVRETEKHDLKSLKAHF
jgi:hypothetical protein